MVHVTHTAFLWILAGGATAALLLWLGMLSSMEGERLGPEVERLLTDRPASPAASGVEGSERAARAAGDRFRLLGDPEYGLFLEDAASSPGDSVTSAA
jgi:hypothetical protein